MTSLSFKIKLALGVCAALTGMGLWAYPAAGPSAEPIQAPDQVRAQPAATVVPIDPTRAVIDGVVVDEAGAPVAGAQVRVPQSWYPPADGTAAADGRFRITIDYPTARYCTIYASSPDGTKLAVDKTDPWNDGPVVPIRLVLRPAVPIRVTVVDGRDAPVPGAAVAASNTAAVVAHATTDDRGAEIGRAHV